MYVNDRVGNPSVILEEDERDEDQEEELNHESVLHKLSAIALLLTNVFLT